MSVLDRALGGVLDELRQATRQAGAAALLITGRADVRYLTGFSSPEDGRVLITPERALLITDGRYIAQAAEESRLEVDIHSDWLERTVELVGQLDPGPDGKRLAVQPEQLSVARFRQLSERLGEAPATLEQALARHRLIKREDEIALLRRAAAIADAAFDHILGVIRPGNRELEVALELERFMIDQGADGKSFPIIVASGVRSAMPHGVASQKKIAAGELVTLDFGALLGGYHSDMTRTVAVGRISDDHRRLYQAVLDANLAALEVLGPGVDGRDVDLRAREVLTRHGLGEYFVHSLGHGVGLEVHEGPRLSNRASERLEPGMTATIEPGVYQPGNAGVRIEDLTVITTDGYERLSQSPKELITL